MPKIVLIIGQIISWIASSCRSRMDALYRFCLSTVVYSFEVRF